jgi:hypothetical protein
MDRTVTDKKHAIRAIIGNNLLLYTALLAKFTI